MANQPTNSPAAGRRLKRMVSLRLQPDDVRFIINELQSAAAIGAEDEAFSRLPDLLRKALVRHEMKQANSDYPTGKM